MMPVDKGNVWAATELPARYRAVVLNFLAGSPESAQSDLIALGREAAGRQVALAVVAVLHHQVLGELWQHLSESAAANDPQPAVDSFLAATATLLEHLCRGYEQASEERPDRGAGRDRSSETVTQADPRVNGTNAEPGPFEHALRRANDELEQRMQLQSSELRAARDRLRAEINERKLTELALRESEARFRIIFERAGLGIALLDKSGRVRESNPALQQMLGYSSEELHGKTVFDITPDVDLELTRRQFHELVEGRCKDYKLEKRFIIKTGTLLWVRKTVSGVYGSNGELQFAIDLMEDITDRKLSEEALVESESRFRQVADMAGEWIWEQDPDGRYIYSSSAVKEILGYRSEDILGKYYHDLFTPEDQARVVPTAPAMISSAEAFHRIVNRYRHQDGHEVFTESTGAPILDRDGNLLKWRGVDHDVTERKRFEDALRLRDRAIEASSVGIIITDPHQRGNPIIYTNPAFVAMTGYDWDEVMGKNPGFLQGPDTDPKAIEQIRHALQEGCDCHLTLKNYRKDGTQFWNELMISPVRDEQGRLTHFIGTQMDVTALRRLEEERHEMEIAKEIQLSLLPTAPLFAAGILVAGYCLPATHVGGDYFDYFSSENAVDIVIADVSGHSVAAAMIMAEARSTLKMETHRMLKEKAGLPQGAAAILSNLNSLLFDDLNRSDRFITMFYAQYDATTRELTYANAGHNCPLLLRGREHACMELDAEGLILGVRQETYFEERKLHLEKNDTLLFYTDGITEAENKAGEFFGTQRLCDIFATHAEASNQEIIDAVMAELQQFCQRTSFSDDISLVVLKVT